MCIVKDVLELARLVKSRIWLATHRKIAPHPLPQIGHFRFRAIYVRDRPPTRLNDFDLFQKHRRSMTTPRSDTPRFSLERSRISPCVSTAIASWLMNVSIRYRSVSSLRFGCCTIFGSSFASIGLPSVDGVKDTHTIRVVVSSIGTRQCISVMMRSMFGKTIRLPQPRPISSYSQLLTIPQSNR